MRVTTLLVFTLPNVATGGHHLIPNLGLFIEKLGDVNNEGIYLTGDEAVNHVELKVGLPRVD